MPGRDGTGPSGLGSMTGRGRGINNSKFIVGVSSQDRCYGNYGCQRGFRRQFYATGVPGYRRNNISENRTSVDEKTLLTNQETILENQLKIVKVRLSHLNSSEE